jgi:hypothetical protein
VASTSRTSRKTKKLREKLHLKFKVDDLLLDPKDNPSSSSVVQEHVFDDIKNIYDNNA